MAHRPPPARRLPAPPTHHLIGHSDRPPATSGSCTPQHWPDRPPNRQMNRRPTHPNRECPEPIPPHQPKSRQDHHRHSHERSGLGAPFHVIYTQPRSFGRVPGKARSARCASRLLPRPTQLITRSSCSTARSAPKPSGSARRSLQLDERIGEATAGSCTCWGTMAVRQLSSEWPEQALGRTGWSQSPWRWPCAKRPRRLKPDPETMTSSRSAGPASRTQVSTTMSTRSSRSWSEPARLPYDADDRLSVSWCR
jgi:hypothetical protein